MIHTMTVTRKSPFDTIILDLGGVFIKSPSRVSSNKSIPSLKRLQSTLPWMKYECNQIGEAECYETLGKQFNFLPSELIGAIAKARMTVEYGEVMVAWLCALREERRASASPLKIVAMSNISQPNFDAVHARWGADFWVLFDQVFISAAVGLRKHSLGFYQHVLDAASIDPLRAILYGFKQSAIKWQRKAKMLLASKGFMPLKSDDAVFYSQKTGDVVTTHIDDFLIMGQSLQRLEELVTSLQKDVKLNILGNADWFLGMKILRSTPTGDVRLDLEQYIGKALQACNYSKSRSMATPFDSSLLQHTSRVGSPPSVAAASSMVSVRWR
jgi:FMN phosphatase YigB (HAD superfamily)